MIILIVLSSFFFGFGLGILLNDLSYHYEIKPKNREVNNETVNDYISLP